MAKEDATGQAVESSMEQLLDINRKQSEIISAQARTIEELRGTIVELNASLAWLKRKVFGKMSEKNHKTPIKMTTFWNDRKNANWGITENRDVIVAYVYSHNIEE